MKLISKKINFKTHYNNDFILWVFILSISLVLFFELTDALFKYVFLMLIIISSLIALRETLWKFETYEEKKPLKEIGFLHSIYIFQNIKYGLWIIGLGLLYYSFLFLIFFPEFIAYPNLIDIIMILSPVMMAIGFLFFFFGIFNKIRKESMEYPIEKFSRYTKNIGLIIVLIAIFLLSYTFIPNDQLIVNFIFFGTFILGISLLLIEEIMLKERTSYVVLFFILLIFGIFSVTNYFNFSQFTFSYEPNLDFEIAPMLSIFELLYNISFYAFMVISIFYILNINSFRQEELKKKKDTIMHLVVLSFFLYLGSTTLFILLILI